MVRHDMYTQSMKIAASLNISYGLATRGIAAKVIDLEPERIEGRILQWSYHRAAVSRGAQHIYRLAQRTDQLNIRAFLIQKLPRLFHHSNIVCEPRVFMVLQEVCRA